MFTTKLMAAIRVSSRTKESSGSLILPDIIANAGGVIVSYLEWLQNKENEHWTEEELNTKLADYIKKPVKEIYDYSKTKAVSLNEAAFALAIRRLVQ